MLQLIPALQSQINDHDTHFLAGCWRIALTRANGRVFHLTDSPTDLTLFDGATYKASVGVNPSAIRREGGATPNNMTTRGVVASDGISDVDLAAGLFDDAVVDYYLVDTRMAWLYPIDFQRYRIQRVAFNGSWWDGELSSVAIDFTKPAGDFWGPLCRVPVFSQKCGLDADVYVFASTISAVPSQYTVFRSNSGIPFSWTIDNWGNDGEIEFTTGLNAGWKTYIKKSDYTGSLIEIELHLQTPFTMAAGDAFIATPGCNKQWNGDCKAKFNNTINFQGEPFIPGGDKARRGLNIIV